MSSSTLKWTPWGGVGEIGMNCMVLEFGSHAIPIDAGVMFADANDYGIEAIFADFEQLLEKYQPKEWLITHVHEDHIGAVPYIFLCALSLGMEAPKVYAPPLAAALIKEKIKDVLPHKLYDSVEKVFAVEIGSSVQMGDVSATFVGVAHSAPQSTAIALEWKVAGRSEPVRVVHTGDFKEDTTQPRRGLLFDDKWQKYQPDLMFVDSTNANRRGHSTAESNIIAPLQALVKDAPGRVFITMFSSNAERVAALSKVAKACKRNLALAGRSLQTMMRLSTQVGVFGEDDVSTEVLCDVTELRNFQEQNQLIICSGSQGEIRSVLNRMANGTHPEFYVKDSDTIIFSSKIIPGNEKPIYRMINKLLAQGARVLWEEQSLEAGFGPIHASGHGRRDEIASVLTWLDPKILVPVHGNVFQMKEVELLATELRGEGKLSAVRVFGAENGDVLEFALDVAELKNPTRTRYAEYMPKFLRFENFVSPSLDPFLRMRKRAASGGIISVVLDSSGRSRVRVEGVAPSSGPRKEMLTKVHVLVDDFCKASFRQLAKDWPFAERAEQMERELSDVLARDLRKLIGSRPAAVVHLLGL